MQQILSTVKDAFWPQRFAQLLFHAQNDTRCNQQRGYSVGTTQQEQRAYQFTAVTDKLWAERILCITLLKKSQRQSTMS